MVCFTYISTSQSITGGSQGRNSSKDLEAGTEVESSKDVDYWLTPSDLLFSQNLAPHVQEWDLPEWAGAVSIN